VSALEHYTAFAGQEIAMTPNIDTGFEAAARAPTTERPFAEYLAEMTEVADVRRGIPSPLGAREFEGGVNFALFSRDATQVQLEFFAQAADSKPERIVVLDPTHNRTGDVWHVWIKGIAPGQLYAYRLDGPNEPATGLRFDFNKLLLDPYATAIKRAPSGGKEAKCVFTRDRFDWRDDKPPRHPWSQTVIYETHVRGLTAHPSSAVRFPGSYRGLIEKIPYLKELGVTTIELLPVQEFNANSRVARADNALRNYWGYDPISFFAPNGAYSSAGDAGQQILEFKEMVRQLHAAGIELIVDIVLNHTAESGEEGPTLCWRGIDNPIYYSLAVDKRRYVDLTGEGNTINASHPVVREMIISALRHWVVEMHIDGFRLDLASLLGRDSAGKVRSNLPLLEQIAEDPILRDAKLIAQSWDVAGAYRVDSFSERRWAEWNGRYRDDVRRFWRGDTGMLGDFASRICGSEDLYAKSGKGPECSINFITCHDGFTLNDLVSYQTKHNLANGEENRDGADENFSANYGVEGPTEDPHIKAVRERQVKNFLLTLFVSRGVPMMLGGDEFCRTKRGNNNAYCQDNDISWYDWCYLQRYPQIHDFVKRMAMLRRDHPVLSRERFYTSEDISWFAPPLGAPNWSDPYAKSLGCLIHDHGRDALYLMFNAEDRPMSFAIPPAPSDCQWRLAIDTSQDLPVPGLRAFVGRDRPYTLESRSSALLVAASVTTGGADSSIDYCAGTMGGDDPSTAYAAAMLWYQGYPYSFPKGV
jgi:glycogen operon protein